MLLNYLQIIRYLRLFIISRSVNFQYVKMIQLIYSLKKKEIEKEIKSSEKKT